MPCARRRPPETSAETPSREGGEPRAAHPTSSTLTGHILEPSTVGQVSRSRVPRPRPATHGQLRRQGALAGGGQDPWHAKGLGLAGSIVARQGTVSDVTMKYVEGRQGGFDPHARIQDLVLGGIDAAFLYPTLGQNEARRPPCLRPRRGSPRHRRRRWRRSRAHHRVPNSALLPRMISAWRLTPRNSWSWIRDWSRKSPATARMRTFHNPADAG